MGTLICTPYRKGQTIIHKHCMNCTAEYFTVQHRAGAAQNDTLILSVKQKGKLPKTPSSTEIVGDEWTTSKSWHWQNWPHPLPPPDMLAGSHFWPLSMREKNIWKSCMAELANLENIPEWTKSRQACSSHCKFGFVKRGTAMLSNNKFSCCIHDTL